MRALNAHLNSMQKLLGDHGGSYETDGTKGNRSDLSTIRWDIIDPGAPADAATTGLPTPGKRGAEVFDDADDEEDEFAAPAPLVRGMRQSAVDNGDGTVSHVSVYPQANGKEAGPKKRRGRKPRHSAPGEVSLAGGQGERQTPAHGQHERPSGTPARQPSAGHGATPSSAPAGAAPIGYGAFNQVDEHGNKKKGRPFGWRKSVHSREAHGLASANASTNPGSSKRPSHLQKSQKASEAQEPKYSVYKCQWEGCKAELHNLDTLKKHIVRIHGYPAEDGEYECHWQPCDGVVDATGAVGAKGKQRVTDVASFPDIEAWMGHVDKQHLHPVAWELGDGPRGGVSGMSSHLFIRPTERLRLR